MKLLALCSWFDEQREALLPSLDSWAKAGVTHLVAVDGRYALFPSDRDASPAEQRGWLDVACRHLGIGSTVHVHAGPWEGGEVEKRTAMFQLALAVSDPGDWWLIADADMPVTEAPPDLLDRLAGADEESAVVRMHDVLAAKMDRVDYPADSPFRCLYRAHPMAVGPAHWRYYSVVDGHDMWRGTDTAGLREPLDLYGAVTMEHRPHVRTTGRTLQKNQYYSRRDTTGIEMGKCPRCNQQATVRMTIVDRVVHSAEIRRAVEAMGKRNQGLPVGHVEEVCESCATGLHASNRRRLIGWGFPPDAPVNERYALPK